GLLGDAINVMLAAAAYNFKRAMRLLWLLLKRISETLTQGDISLKFTF
ncbi:MAG: IS5/IS1182 family transposase, partial [Bacteroidales bacterium]|nr:IS5/IS1182 family transposase [Bacteroidales bacterium]